MKEGYKIFETKSMETANLGLSGSAFQDWKPNQNTLLLIQPAQGTGSGEEEVCSQTHMAIVQSSLGIASIILQHFEKLLLYVALQSQ